MTARLAITTGTLLPRSDLINRCRESWWKTIQQPDFYEWLERENTPDDNRGVTGSLQWLYEHTTAPIIAHLHSDVEIFEQGWDERVLAEFADPKVGVVGFGGAAQLGHDDLFKTPYHLQQLARYNYASNTSDAEAHGERFAGAKDVAVLDGFALIVRRALLDKAGGWPVKELPFHMYDAWLAGVAREHGYRTRLVGIQSRHWGGQTATTPEYQQWSLGKLGKPDHQVHTDAHTYVYSRFRKVLPICVS